MRDVPTSIDGTGSNTIATELSATPTTWDRASRVDESPVPADSRHGQAESLPGYLFVLPWDLDRPGGVDQVVLNLFEQVRRSGRYNPQVLIADWHHREPVERLENGRSVVRRRLRAPSARRFSIVALARWLFGLPFELPSLVAYLDARRVEVVNVHFPSLAALNMCIAKRFVRRPLKVVLSFHGRDIALAQDESRLGRFLWRALLRCADGAIACSRNLAGQVRAFEPRAAGKVRAIHNGIDADAFLAERDPTSFLDPRLKGRPFVLSVAAWEHKKGVDVLIDAFAALVRDADPALALVLVGTDQGLRAELETRASAHGLSTRVFFFEDVPHSRLHVLYEAATVFCLPSRSEPFGLVQLEAAAFGLPVVATRVGGIPEVITDGVDGRLVEPDNPAVLAAALKDLLGDSRERVRLGSALCRKVRTDFTWERAFREYAAVLAVDSTNVG